MQCSNCSFYNMPGVPRCGQCNAVLSVEEVDVNPPRATKSQKYFQNLLPRYRKFLNATHFEVASVILPELQDSPFEGRLIDYLCLLFGGLYQFVNHWHGRWIWISAWTVSIILAFITFGTEFGSICLGIAFGIHVASIVAIFVPRATTLPERLRATVLAVLMVCATYGSTLYLLNYGIVPIQIVNEQAGFHSGDTLWYTRAAPAVGQFAVIRSQGTVGLRLDRGNANYRLPGRSVYRVWATAGQTIEWNEKSILIDGVATDLQAPGLNRNVPAFRWNIPPGHIFIIPEFVNAGNIVDVVRPELQSLMIIPGRDILGRVIFQSYPWSKMKLY